ncbi:MAG: M20/M25/M40 family metallo-hydrolase [Thermomicrobiales bacterium]
MLTLEGMAGPHLAFCGHTDTKPAGDAISEWRTDPYVRTTIGDRLYGLGSTGHEGRWPRCSMQRSGCSVTRISGQESQFLVQRGRRIWQRLWRPLPCQGGGTGRHRRNHPGRTFGHPRRLDAIRIVSRGASLLEVVVRGTQMHSSLSDSLGAINAVEAMARLMVCFRDELELRYPEHPLCPTGPTINIGVRTVGGVGYGVVPGQATFYSDIRTLPGMDQETFREDIQAAIDRCSPVLNGATATVVWPEGMSWSAATEVAPDHPAVVASRRAARAVLGHEAPIAAFTGGTDAIAFQGLAGIPILAALGPGLLPLAHGPNEWVSLISLRQAMRIYVLTAIEYCRLV